MLAIMPRSAHHLSDFVTTASSQATNRMDVHILALRRVRWAYSFYNMGVADSNIAKQCYHCQGLGHVQADCPTLRLSGGATGGRCYSCNQPGHFARNCPTPGSAPPMRGGARGGYGGGFRGGYAGTNRAATCYKCGGPNHYARDCQAQAMKCYACGKLVSPERPIVHFHLCD